MEQVKKLLQVSQDNLLTKDKEVDELKSQTAVQKVSKFGSSSSSDQSFGRLIWNNAAAVSLN